MSNGLLGSVKALLYAFLLSAICLLLLCAFAFTRDAPEDLILGCSHAALFFGALIAGFLGAKKGSHFLNGVITTALFLMLILFCSVLFPSTSSPTEKWTLLAIALACGMVGSLIGGKRKTKVIRRKRAKHRG